MTAADPINNDCEPKATTSDADLASTIEADHVAAALDASKVRSVSPVSSMASESVVDASSLTPSLTGCWCFKCPCFCDKHTFALASNTESPSDSTLPVLTKEADTPAAESARKPMYVLLESATAHTATEISAEDTPAFSARDTNSPVVETMCDVTLTPAGDPASLMSASEGHPVPSATHAVTAGVDNISSMAQSSYGGLPSMPAEDTDSSPSELCAKPEGELIVTAEDLMASISQGGSSTFAKDPTPDPALTPSSSSTTSSSHPKSGSSSLIYREFIQESVMRLSQDMPSSVATDPAPATSHTVQKFTTRHSSPDSPLPAGLSPAHSDAAQHSTTEPAQNTKVLKASDAESASTADTAIAHSLNSTPSNRASLSSVPSTLPPVASIAASQLKSTAFTTEAKTSPSSSPRSLEAASPSQAASAALSPALSLASSSVSTPSSTAPSVSSTTAVLGKSSGSFDRSIPTSVSRQPPFPDHPPASPSTTTSSLTSSSPKPSPPVNTTALPDCLPLRAVPTLSAKSSSTTSPTVLSCSQSHSPPPSTSHPPPPSTSHPPTPSASPPAPPSTSHPPPTSTSHHLLPSTSTLPPPSTSHLPTPATSHPPTPSTSYPPPPSTSYPPPPSISHPSPPSSSHPPPPSTPHPPPPSASQASTRYVQITLDIRCTFAFSHYLIFSIPGLFVMSGAFWRLTLPRQELVCDLVTSLLGICNGNILKAGICKIGARHPDKLHAVTAVCICIGLMPHLWCSRQWAICMWL